MRKILLIVAGFLLASNTLLFSQDVTLHTFGVSPRDVARDTIEQYFDRAYNGLMNVGKETKVYLKGESDEALSNPTWNLLLKPGGSATTFGTTLDLDTNVQIINFIPDLVGTYKIEFKDGTGADTIVINSATYLGVEGGAVSCIGCHNTQQWDFKYDKWLMTGHASMLERGLNGTLSSYYRESCIGCHTVGYDPDASNDGFDDFTFVFPDSLYPGVYDQMLALYPDAMARANIQCESCHGPGSAHLGIISNSKMVKQIDTKNCAWCHDSGSHHFFPEQWNYSKHSNGRFYGNRSSCTGCHNGQGFIDRMEGEPQTVVEVIPITCASCHDPHSAELPHQVRTITATLENGFEVSGKGSGALCISCHHSRRNGIQYVNNYLNNLSSHYGPHGSLQADMLIGTNTYTWGQTLPSSAHFTATEKACVTCHMSEVSHEAEIQLVGQHTFNMVSPDNVDNVLACEPCHGDIGEEFNDKNYYVNGSWADLDGDGTVEGLQHEIHGLLDELALLLPPVGSTDINVIDSTWTLDQAAGLYNYRFVEEDGSFGVHNPAFTYELLVLNINKLGGVVNVPEDDSKVPSDYSLAQNYPNPFNPSTTIEFSVPKQSNIKVVVYDALGNQLDVIHNGLTEAGNYKVTWDAANYASGIYFYRMESDNFVQVRKMLLMK